MMAFFNRPKVVGNKEEKKELMQGITETLGYPYRIFSAGTSYKEIMSVYEKEVSRGEKEHFTPVLVPVDEVLERELEFLKINEKYLKNLLKKNISSKDGKEILNKRYDESEFMDEFFYESMSEDMDKEVKGWYEGIDYYGEPEGYDGFSAFFDYATGKCTETILFYVPTDKPWEVVGYIPFGGWNDCPAPEEMMAICKYWYEKYDAVPVAISSDILEMRVPSPVSQEDSIELAKEQAAFNPDLVDYSSMKKLAGSLELSTAWHFWWD